MESINRREAIKRTAAITGCVLSGSLITAVMSGCRPDSSNGWKPSALTQNQLQAAADFAEVILPRTDTPGAKDAKTERFIDSLADGYLSPEEKNMLIQFLNKLDEENFSSLSFDEQTSFTKRMLDTEEDRRFFRSFKSMTLLGFFTSEIGATQVLSYDEIPGIFSGCEMLQDVGGKTWAL
jgi:gluconate 2-dehydrogenase gamma chain